MKKKILSIIVSFAILLTALTSLSAFSFSASAASYTADSSWYDKNATTLYINDIPDFIAFMNKLNELGTSDDGGTKSTKGYLAGIAWFSDSTKENQIDAPFTGQTVILNTDIVLNEGINFTNGLPSNVSEAYCFSRTSKQVGFGGTFDGKGHTLSGIYIDTNKGGSGSLFGVGGTVGKSTPVVIKNLQIKNSLIKTTSKGIASILSSVAYEANATISNVYSEVTLLSEMNSADAAASKMAGFCATVGGNLEIVSSVYAGKMLFSSAASALNRIYNGGFVGNFEIFTKTNTNTFNFNAGKLSIDNCAYYGSISNKMSESGKVAGRLITGTTVTVKNSLLLGTFNTAATTVTNFSKLVGEKNGTATYTNVIATPATRSNTTISETATGVTNITSANSLKGDKDLDDVKPGLSTYWIANGTPEGYPVPSALYEVIGERSLKHDYLTPLPISAEDLYAQLGAKLENTGYTEESYAEYSDAYDALVDEISAADGDTAALEAIDIAARKAEIESLLLTPFAALKAAKLAEVGEKKTNDNGEYTAISYAKYDEDFEFLVASIEAAENEADLNKIDVKALLAEAEAKLEKTVKEPDSSETDPIETDPIETEPIETEPIGTEPAQTESAAPNATETEDNSTEYTEKKGKGCKSTAGLASVAIVTLIGAAGVMLGKKRR